MALLDLEKGLIARDIRPTCHIDGAQPLETQIPVLDQSAVISVTFPKFTDGRGFTIARRLRGEFGFTGVLIAAGDLIADQADYLRRCGFSHAVITAEYQHDWQFALSTITTRFQHSLDDPRSRAHPDQGLG